MDRFGMLTPRDRAYQAEAFVQMYEREGGTDWEARFEQWAGVDGKDFMPRDKAAVRRIVSEMLLGRATTVVVDLSEWLAWAPAEP